MCSNIFPSFIENIEEKYSLGLPHRKVGENTTLPTIIAHPTPAAHHQSFTACIKININEYSFHLSSYVFSSHCTHDECLFNIMHSFYSNNSIRKSRLKIAKNQRTNSKQSEPQKMALGKIQEHRASSHRVFSIFIKNNLRTNLRT